MGSPISIQAHFAQLHDPRDPDACEHKLLDILVIALCAVICGAEHFTEMEVFGQAKEKWFRTFLALPNGIPSHDTFRRVFMLLDREQMQTCFRNWVREVARLQIGEVVSLDGKWLTGTATGGMNFSAAKMVSAWASEAGLVLGQRGVAEGSNEIAAVPELLKALYLRGCIVTMDAAHCQTENTRLIVEAGADYVLAVKDNQGTLYEDIRRTLSTKRRRTSSMSNTRVETRDDGHGRLEIRRYVLITDPTYIDYINHTGHWHALRSIGRVERERRVGDTVEHHTAYFISSLNTDAADFERAVRRHWNIENELHWRLDVALREDDCRVRTARAVENFAVMRHIALNLLKRDTSLKVGVKSKRLAAGWDHDYLLKLLTGEP
ncbi:MAG: ISAs1 family transposase [Anaerolineae bacterium]|nr:ISAs1 family transposase [Candidatus Roseilinea sp.]MDW8450084.1 ISAs1 family transposase [Anaerolineae bacterium]